MTDPNNPYETPADPTRPLVNTDEDRVVLYHPDGTSQPLGSTHEATIMDPVTGDQRYIRTLATLSTADGALLFDPTKHDLHFCQVCHRVFKRDKPDEPRPTCNGCGIGLCDACAGTMQDETNAIRRFCPTCFHRLRWTRLWLAIKRFFRWLLTATR